MGNQFFDNTPMLRSSNLQRSIDWYESVLGFQCVSRIENWCRLERDGASIMFMINDHHGTPHATGTQYFYVEDAMALWDQIKDRVKAEWGPELMSYGKLEFAIKDPDGYFLSFGQSVRQ